MEYSNSVRKIQRMSEGGGWQVTGKNQEAGNLTHFGYQILPELLKEWFGKNNMAGTQIGMIPKMSTTQETNM